MGTVSIPGGGAKTLKTVWGGHFFFNVSNLLNLHMTKTGSFIRKTKILNFDLRTELWLIFALNFILVEGFQ